MKNKSFMAQKINIDSIDKDRFNNSISIALSDTIGSNGIGTLSEKSVHATLKYYYEPNHDFHEIPINGYVADAFNDGEILEIQTKSFFSIKEKLISFLRDYDVTVIYPVAVKKYIRYITPETGKITEPVVSPKSQGLYSILPELYGIRDLLSCERLHFIMCFINIEEYKLLDGTGKDKKIHCTKLDRVPLEILGEYYINSSADLTGFLPAEELPKNFTTKDISEISGYNISYAQLLVNILSHLNLIECTGKKGRYKLWTILPATLQL